MIRLTGGVVAALASAAVMAQPSVTSEWADAVSGSWSNASNWTPAMFPDNDASNTFGVSISAVGTAFVVDLDIDAMIDELTLDSGDATLDLSGRTLSVLDGVTLSGSTLRGLSSGRFEASGLTGVESMVFDGAFSAVFNDGATFSGNTVTGSSVELGGLTSFLGGGQMFEGATLLLGSDGTTTGPGDVIICDTDVDHEGRSLAFAVDTRFLLEGDSSFFNATGSEISITGMGDRTVMGVSGENEFHNAGTLLLDQLESKTSITGTTFKNSGLVDVVSGTLETDGATITSGGKLESGNWIVRDEGEIDFMGATVNGLAMNAEVTLEGANAKFDAIEGSLQTVQDSASLYVLGGAELTVEDGFAVMDSGKVTIGVGSKVSVDGTFANLTSGSLMNGRFDVGGVIEVAAGEGVESLSANITLRSEGGVFDTNGIDAFDQLAVIEKAGRLELLEGRQIATIDNLDVKGELVIGGGGGEGSRSAARLGTIGEMPTSGSAVRAGGDYVQRDGSRLHIMISSVEEFGRLEVDRSMIFGENGGFEAGTLLLEFAGPAVNGSAFEIISADQFVLGRFADLETRGLSGGLSVIVEYGIRTVTVYVVPSGATAAPLLAAMGLIGARRRRGSRGG